MDNMQLPLNWFDIVALIFLLLGLKFGRTKGMSEQWLFCIQWVLIVSVGCFAYRPISDYILKIYPMNRTLCHVGVYLFIASIFKLFFGKIKESLPPRFAGPSDLFGKYEYYLGMMAGVFRHACMLIAFMAMLNAPYYSAQESARAKAMQNDVYGSNFFPTIDSIQHGVIKESFFGKAISENAGNLLIAMNRPASPAHKKSKDNLP
jgi:uncharacterized membrane protein required for colicin V production